jgi:hypothetical protein
MPFLIALWGLLPAIVQAAIVSGVISGITYGISAALAPGKPKSTPISTRADNLKTILRNNTAPVRVGYGVNLSSGILAFAESVNADGNLTPNPAYLHFCLVIAAGPITDIYDVELNDNPISTARYSNLALFVPFMGHIDQPMLVGSLTMVQQIKLPKSWLAKYRPLRGIAYCWVVLKWDLTVFAGGAPNVRFKWKGRALYDPREDASLGGGQLLSDQTTWRYSTNWALCVRDFLTNRYYGRSFPETAICQDCLIASANISDEIVPAPSRGPTATRKRYTCEGIFESDDKPIDIASRLMFTAAGAMHFYDGKWHIRAGAPDTVALDGATGLPITIGEDDLRTGAALTVSPRPGKKSRVNTVTGTFINVDNHFQPDSFPPVTHPDFINEDGNQELTTEIELPFTRDVDQARTVATILLKQSRLGIRISFPGKPSLQQLTPWMVVYVELPNYGWGGSFPQKKFRVFERTLNEDGSVDLVLTEYDDDLYVFTIDPSKLPPTTGLPDPFHVGPPIHVLVRERIFTTADGTRIASLHVTWDPPIEGTYDGYRIRYRAVTSSDPTTLTWQERTVRQTNVDLEPLPAGDYEIRVATTSGSLFSLEVVRHASITYVTLPPPAPVDFRIKTGAGNIRTYTWGIAGGREPKDIAGYELRYREGSFGSNPVAEWNEAKLLVPSIVRAQHLDTAAPVKPATYTFYIRTLDTTGQYSDGVAFVQAALILLEGFDILLQRDFKEEGWPTDPGGSIADGRITPLGHLEGASELRWSDITTWASVKTWGDVSQTPLVYTSDIMDLKRPRNLRFDWHYAARDAGSVRILIATRAPGDDGMSTFTTRRTASSVQWVQVQIIVSPSQRTPMLEAFLFIIAEEMQTVEVNDIDMVNMTANLFESIGRDDDTDATWHRGPFLWKVNTALQTGADIAVETDKRALTVDRNSVIRTPGTATSYVEIPQHIAQNLEPPMTIEAMGRVDNTTGFLLPYIDKPNAWSIVYTPGSGFLFYAAPGFFGDDPLPISTLPVQTNDFFHIAYIYTGHQWMGLLNGIVRFNVGRNFILNSSNSPMRFGQRASGGALSGIFSEVRIWSKARSIDQIRAAMHVQVDPGADGLIGYWRGGDRTSTTRVPDLSYNQNHGTMVGLAARRWIAAREGPPIPLALIPRIYGVTMHWEGDLTNGQITVEASINDGATWQVIPEGAITFINGLVANDLPPAGAVLRYRQYIESFVQSPAPKIDTLNITLGFIRAPGDLVLQPSVPMSEIRQATVTAFQNFGIPVAAHTVFKDPNGLAARFQITSTASGTPQDGLVDVLYRGARLG